MENQHWIPRFLIKNFTDKDGRVFQLDIHTDNVTKPPPKYAASDNGFNDFVIDGQFISFEQKLGHIENAAAPIIRRLVTTQSTKDINHIERINV